MQNLYKYLPEQYVDDFIKKGAILFRSLAYFRDYEDSQIRGDEFEGIRLFRPPEGLQVTVKTTQETLILPHRLESSANEEDIFVYCLSTVLSQELANDFKTSVCIEIFKPAHFLGKVREALLRRPSIRSKWLVHGEVNYYSPESPPLADWALPEKITMSKLAVPAYVRQQEYRLAFAVNDAFKVENTRLCLAAANEQRTPIARQYSTQPLKIGNLGKMCRIHRFD